MKKYISLWVLLFMGLLSVYFYYIYYPIHSENKQFLFSYLFVMAVVYSIYKLVGALMEEATTHVSALKLLVVFLTHFWIICICFFAFTSGSPSYGLILFFKVLLYLSCASAFWLIFYGLWDTIMKYFSYLSLEKKSIKITTSLGIWFSVFMLGVFILMSINLYQPQYILVLLALSVLIGHKSLMSIFKSLKLPLKTYSHDVSTKATFSEKYNTGLIIDEIHYLIITFLISINLVSVYRPFPIGWDDLWAYMNYPKLLSGAWEHIALGKMYMWEMYTGIWFLFGSQTFAFYLNTFGWIIASIVIYLSISWFVKKRETSFDLWLFSVMILLMMPMVVFQLAKDMKLDLGLLSMSIIALALLYEILFSKNTRSIGLYALVWIFIGVAFSIKVTSLLLLLWAFSAVFYKKYSLTWVISFILMFVWIFSYLDLWSMMNVVISSEIQNIKIFSILSMFLWFALFIGTHIYQKHSEKNLIDFISKIGLILLWFIIALLPWGGKHIWEATQNSEISVKTLISWSSERYNADYSLIFSQEELDEIEEKKDLKVTSVGTTTNADFGRYFGYEEGINNYLKLPWNLSFQTNQAGEFTDISYIFFALLPALFLFLPYRKEVYKYPVIAAILISLAYFIPSPISVLFVNVFSSIHLPYWYLVIGGICLFPLAYFHFALDKTDKISKIFLVNFAFSTVYIGLWAVSAFGIVWYGILMYFCLLLMITLCLLSIQSIKSKESELALWIVLVIVWGYVLQSSIPHGITNMRSAGYHDYKLWGMTEEVALMTFHPEYFSILFELNIWDEYKDDLFVTYRNNTLEILDETDYAEKLVPQIQVVSDISDVHEALVQISKFDLGSSWANEDIGGILQSLYEEIIYPDEDLKNNANIHRVWTFLKYYISENNTRLFEDNLLSKFQDYMHDDINTSLERYKKLDISYILLDINAATIDNDPVRSLTQRYENILEILTHRDISLIETDSICLRLALDEYKLNGNLDTYIELAGVNYSYKQSAQDKKTACVKRVMDILSSSEETKKYPYLSWYIQALQNAGVSLDDGQAIYDALSRSIKNGYKVLLKIND